MNFHVIKNNDSLVRDLREVLYEKDCNHRLDKLRTFLSAFETTNQLEDEINLNLKV